MFSVEIHLRFACPNCQQQLKRRFLDYLTSRTTHCTHCVTKIVHLARGQTTEADAVQMADIQNLIDNLEQNWGSLVNEVLSMESKQWGDQAPPIQD